MKFKEDRFKGVRRVRYREIPEVVDDAMPRTWSSWKRKKVEEGGAFKLLKIDGYKTACQVAVQDLKPIFAVEPMELEVVYDLDEERLGSLITMAPAFGDIGKTGIWWMRDRWNMEEICRILILDSVVANNDRMTVNVLVRRNFRILAIDEADSFRWHAPIKCKFRKSIKSPVQAFAWAYRKWLRGHVQAVMEQESDVERILNQTLLPEDVERAIARLRRMPEIVEVNFGRKIL